MTHARLRKALADRLHHPSPSVRAAAVERVGLLGHRALLFAVLENVKTTDPMLGRATAFALARFPNQSARVGLLHLLQHRDRSVVLAAIEGLRAIGSTNEIPHLRAIGGGWFGDRTLKRAAHAAIAAIQDGSERGSLSLAEGGSLSLDRNAGSLALK